MVYKYLHLDGKRFISLDQSLLHLLCLLIWRRSLFPKGLGRKALVNLIKAKFFQKYERKVLQLPVNGTWCRSVRGGVKVFDTGRKRVTKIYDPGTDKELIKREVDLFSMIGHQDFAASMKNWNFDEGWYEEEFITGASGYGLIPSESSDVVMDRYFSFVEPTLEKIIMAGSPAPLSALNYLATIENAIEIGSGSTNDKDVLKFHSFIYEMTSRCKNLIGASKPNIYLTMCHGDFHQFNMFRTRSRLKLIDWEAAQRLSIMFDVFNFFFSQMYLKSTSWTWPEKVKKGVNRMAFRLSAGMPQLAENIVDYHELYRRIYYIERTFTFLGSFGLDNQRIGKWVRAFEEFENVSGGCRI